MNRRNFLGLTPVGLAGLAISTVKGEEPKTEIKKAKMIGITGPNGEVYHPLVVEAEDTQYANVQLPPVTFATHSLGVERVRLTSTGELRYTNPMSITAEGMLGIG
jgi:hypothetical protein